MSIYYVFMIRKGSYVLLLHLPKTQQITIGKKGPFTFKNGYYAYVGSALNGLDQRLRRHLSFQKKFHWHIDYLLEHAHISDIYTRENNRREECDIAASFNQKFSCIHEFGSSDCTCTSHLFFGDEAALKTHIVTLDMKKANL